MVQYVQEGSRRGSILHMPGDNRQQLRERMAVLTGIRAKQWAGVGRNLPDPNPQEATVEMLGLLGLLIDDWNAELHVAHERLTEETGKLAAATEKLDVSTQRLDSRTAALSGATKVLIIATAVLVVATVALAVTTALAHLH
jgi:hypothetical protein